MSAASLPIIGIVAAGAMGSAVASNLTKAGCTVLTNLDGRSEATRKRAHDAGMKDVSLADMARQADWVLSILPPSDAFSFGEKFLAEARDLSAPAAARKPLVFVDCNAINPETAKRIAWLFGGSAVKFIDAGIIGVPPSLGYDPTFYASVDEKDAGILDQFAKLSQYGLKISPLKGDGAGIGDASALKMSYAVRTFTAQQFNSLY
jgi:NAD(P)-dependent dehydrogenase (short-subunit alcohol dehydrogenase family)